MPRLCYSVPLLCGADFAFPSPRFSQQCYSFAAPRQSMRNHSVAVLGISILFTAYPMPTMLDSTTPLRFIINLTLLYRSHSVLCLGLLFQCLSLLYKALLFHGLTMLNGAIPLLYISKVSYSVAYKALPPIISPPAPISSHTNRPLPLFLHCPSPLYLP